MNQKTLTPAEKRTLFSLVCYGRGTPANIARALDIDRRTAQRLTDEEYLADIIPPVAAVEIGTWYALLDRHLHLWTTPDGIRHEEAKTASAVRGDLAFLVRETVGDNLKKRLVEECPSVWRQYSAGTGHRYTPKRELKEALDRDFTIPDEIARVYRYRPAPTFRDANGDEI